MSDPVIQTQGLTRHFGRAAAVRGLNLEVPRGSVFAFLGRNGSGKSTTIKMLLGMLPPTSGTCSILGCDSRALTPDIRARVGYLSEDHPLYGWMNVREIRDFQSAFFSRWNDEVFNGVTRHFGLKDRQKVRSLSRGERAGLALALTLAPDPELLILDDPAMGLDPVARRLLLESMVYITRREDRTIFFSSHELSDIERVADWIGILSGGVLHACCRVETFRGNFREVQMTFDKSPPALPSLGGVVSVRRLPRELRVICILDDKLDAQFATMGARSIESLPVSLEEALVGYLGGGQDQTFFLQEKEVFA
jgi:ABC-2 type transport system ATP-binding protein